MLFRVLPLHERPVPAVMRVDGVLKKLFQLVEEAVNGMLYVPSSDRTPVDELYVRPVTVSLNSPRIYEGVRAVVEAEAASQEAMSELSIPKASEAVKTGSDSVNEVR